MKRGTIAKVGTILIVIAVLLVSTGCNRLLYGSSAVSAVTGWLFGSLFTGGQVDRQCYMNGVLINCADLPADLGQ